MKKEIRIQKGFSYGEQFNGEKTIPTLKVLAYEGKGEVLTHIAWNDYRIKLEYLIARNNDKAVFYNATEGGAYINFAKNISFKECCEKFFTQKKPSLNIPKPFTYNRSLKFLSKIFLHLKNDFQSAQDILRDAHLLNNALINVLNVKKTLPLDFLQNIYQSITDFDFILDNNTFIQDDVLKGTFGYRGNFLSEVIKKRFEDETHYFLSLIHAYQKWLEKFIEKLEMKSFIIRDAMLEYEKLI